MYRLCAIAKYDDRYVIPPAHREVADTLTERQGGCGLDFAGGPGSCGAGTDTAEGEIDLVALAERGGGDGLSITHVDGNEWRRGMSHDVLRLGALLLEYPDEELFDAPPRRCARRRRRSRPRRARAARRSSSVASRSAATAPRRSTSPRSTSTSAPRCTCPTSATATAASAAPRCSGLKRRYREAGLELEGGELPDYLPAILEFAALAPGEDADAVLGRMRPGIELLRASLHDIDSPYARRARRRRLDRCRR